MSKGLVSDELWEIVEPLLPPEPPKPKGRTGPASTTALLRAGSSSSFESGIPWEMLPKEMGRGSGSTCWRRLRDWQEAGGVWEESHGVLLNRLGEAEHIDRERGASLDSASVPAERGAEEPARIRRRIRERRARSAMSSFRTEEASHSR
jgi:transposase